MSNSKCVYYKEKEQKSFDGGITWVDTGNFRKGALISTQASQCGSYTNEYRWIKADYVCDNANKYNGYKQQVSYDNGGSWVDTGVVDIGELISSNSKDCGYDEKWFTLTGDNDFICDGSSKYKKKEMKYTRDSGTTWNSFDNPKYEKGDLIEENSTDCAILSMKVTYTDGTEKKFYNLTSIEQDTDSNKKNAKEVEIYDSVTSIGSGAFNRCSGLTSIIIPESITIIGKGAFYDCYSLTSITIPNSVTIIDNDAFSYCLSLTGITIPNSVTYIGRSAFFYCSSLSSITIPDSLTSIGNGPFDACSSLSSITVDTGNTVFDSRDNCNAIIRTADNTLIVGCYATVIPNSVTSIGSHAFFVCTSLSSITIPNGVTSIGEDAFLGCSKLSSITIPNGVTSIEEQAFYGCSSLVTVTIKNSKNKIACGYNAFKGIASSAKLYVPSNLLADYQADSKWTNAFKGGIYPIS